jgi:hypothetical protein
MYPIDENTLSFTTTAMPRPELLKITYDSFVKNFQDFDFKKVTLYLNIDSFPDKNNDHKREEVAALARQYFGNVIVNMPSSPNFAAAVKWCFSKIETYYNFHLEDDWELLMQFKVGSFNQFFIPSHVQQVALRAWKHGKSDFWLSPSFMRGTFCREMSEKMNISDNPEVQIRDLKNNYRKESFLYFPFDARGVILKDLGRTWMRDKKYNRGEKNFTKWAIREEGKGIQRLADQNAQIPPGMNVEENKKLSHLNRWSKNYEKQRAFRLSRRNKKT